jgi:hypothetical protein
MPIYRTLKPLTRGFKKEIPRGKIIDITWLRPEQIEKLEQVGAISPLRTPPLHKLPGWKLRAKKLQKVGVSSVEAFLEADPATLAEQVDVQPRTVKKWRDDLMSWLVIPDDAGCCGKGRR